MYRDYRDLSSTEITTESHPPLLGCIALGMAVGVIRGGSAFVTLGCFGKAPTVPALGGGVGMLRLPEH